MDGMTGNGGDAEASGPREENEGETEIRQLIVLLQVGHQDAERGRAEAQDEKGLQDGGEPEHDPQAARLILIQGRRPPWEPRGVLRDPSIAARM